MKFTGPFIFILLTLLIDAMGIGIVFPIMPDLMDRVGAESTAQGALWTGLIASAYWTVLDTPFAPPVTGGTGM